MSLACLAVAFAIFLLVGFNASLPGDYNWTALGLAVLCLSFIVAATDPVAWWRSRRG